MTLIFLIAMILGGIFIFNYSQYIGDTFQAIIATIVYEIILIIGLVVQLLIEVKEHEKDDSKH